LTTSPATPLEDREAIFDLLANMRTIAVVGLSARPERDSYTVSAYLQARGYRIAGVNPAQKEVLGEPCYPSLSEIPEAISREVDLVLVFRRPDEVAPIVAEMAKLGLRRLWLQLGVASTEVIEIASRRGITVVAEKCIRVVHAQMLRQRRT
jgi:hypothetical protein